VKNTNSLFAGNVLVIKFISQFSVFMGQNFNIFWIVKFYFAPSSRTLTKFIFRGAAPLFARARCPGRLAARRRDRF
jgi:hypothetical protein